MKQLFLPILLLFFLISCASLPSVSPVDPAAVPDIRQTCDHLFPEGNWEVVHAIEADMPGSRGGMMIGVTKISAEARTIETAMMTVEGFVVFQGRYAGGKVSVSRGIPPFDSLHFAKGLMEDIRLVFFEPEGGTVRVGITENGRPVCRYETEESGTVDVITEAGDGWLIRQYEGKKLRRTVHALPGEGEGKAASGEVPIPRLLELSATGGMMMPDYNLTLRLIKAEQVDVSNE